jgi:hypothetical protein
MPKRKFDASWPPEWTKSYPGSIVVCVKTVLTYIEIGGLQRRPRDSPSIK